MPDPQFLNEQQQANLSQAERYSSVERFALEGTRARNRLMISPILSQLSSKNNFRDFENNLAK